MSRKWNKLIVALDLEDRNQIKEVVEALGPKGVKFKIGSIAFTKFGPELVKELIGTGQDVFLDLKLYDIPNTTAKTAGIIAKMGCWAFTLHLKAGRKTLEAVKKSVSQCAKEVSKSEPLILGVSILTSSDASQEEVDSLVSLADSAGLSGVISSAHNVEAIKSAFPNLKVVTPGIRNPGEDKTDQVRIATAQQAFDKGADYIVVGRPIVGKKDYLKAAQEVLDSR